MKQKYLRPKEVSEYLGIGLSTVWWYSKNKKLTAIKVSPRVTVFSLDEVNKLVKEVLND